MLAKVLGERYSREGRARFCDTCSLYHVAGARCRPDVQPAPAVPGDVSINALVLREAQREDDERRARVAAGVRAALVSREAAQNELWARLQTRLDEQETGYLAREAAREARIVASREAANAREAAREVAHASCYLTPDACATTGAPCNAIREGGEAYARAAHYARPETRTSRFVS